MNDQWDTYKSLPPLRCPECQADLSYGEGRSGGYQYGPLVVIDCCPGCDAVTLVLLDEAEAITGVYGLSDVQFRGLVESTPIPYAREEREYMRHRIRRGDEPYDNS